MNKLLDLVKVEWVDSCSNTRSWQTDEEIRDWGEDGSLCCTVGFLVQKNKNGLTLASSYGPSNGHWGGAWFIPGKCVRNITRLVPKRKKR